MGFLRDILGGNELVESTTGRKIESHTAQSGNTSGQPQNLQIVGTQIEYTDFNKSTDFRSRDNGAYHTDDGYRRGVGQPFADIVALVGFGVDGDGVYRDTTNYHMWVAGQKITPELVKGFMQKRREQDRRMGYTEPQEYRFVGALGQYYDAETGEPIVR